MKFAQIVDWLKEGRVETDDLYKVSIGNVKTERTSRWRWRDYQGELRDKP